MMFADYNTSVAGDKRGIDDVDLVFGDGFRKTTDEGCEEGFCVDFSDIALKNEVEMMALGRIMLGVEIADFFHEVYVRLETFEFLGEDDGGIDCRGGQLTLKDGKDLLTDVLGDHDLSFGS